VVRLALGCAPLGGLYAAVADEQARATVDAAWRAGIREFDTAPHYGAGLSERRLGAALATRPRDELVISTKVGRLLVTGRAAAGEDMFAGEPARARVFDFSRDGVARSLEQSLERLGMDRVDAVYVHDPDDHMEQAIGAALPALARLRAEGVVRAIGAGMNHAAPLARIVREADVDRVLVAGRCTLLDRSAEDELLPLCAERGVEVVAGGVLNSGILADPRPGAMYDYAPAPPDVLARTQRIAALCAQHATPLLAAALAFPARLPAVAAVLVGARSPAEVAANAAAFAQPVPDALWEELRALV
jgi:D-threo-aldose 1-dehydrogenase